MYLHPLRSDKTNSTYSIIILYDRARNEELHWNVNMSTKQLWLFTSVHVCVYACECVYTPKAATRGPKPKGAHSGGITKSRSPQMFIKYHNGNEKMGQKLSDWCVDVVFLKFCLTSDALDKCGSKSILKSMSACV